MYSKEHSEWIAVSPTALMSDEITAWTTRPECGAVVTFLGTARTSSTTGNVIEELEYETSEKLAISRITDVVASTRTRWSELGAIAVHHRTGTVRVGEPAVVICVSSPHRREAFEACEFLIDTVKKCVPMWKREVWAGGSAWSQEGQDIVDVANL